MVTKLLTSTQENTTLSEKESQHVTALPGWLIKAWSHSKTFRILVPLDGSEFAEDALKNLERLVAVCDEQLTDVVLLRVFNPLDPTTEYPPKTPMDFEQYLDYRRNRAAVRCIDYLQSIKQKLEKKGLDSSYVVREGIPADAISEYARNNSVDLIVMSSHGSNRFRRWLFGSVTDKVTQLSTCPVLAVEKANKKSIMLNVNLASIGSSRSQI